MALAAHVKPELDDAAAHVKLEHDDAVGASECSGNCGEPGWRCCRYRRKEG